MKLLIYSDNLTSRLEYVCQVLFNQWYHIDYQLCSNQEAFSNWDGPKLQYASSRHFPDIPWLFATDFLSLKGLAPYRPELTSGAHQIKGLFPADPQADWPIDIFAQTFYMLSRYEEYLDFQADKHERFPAKESLAHKAEFLQYPIVDHWANLFCKKLEELFPSLNITWPKYQFEASYDIDLAWAYRYRSWRGWASTVRDLLRGNWQQLSARFKAWLDADQDPFFTFSYLESLHEQYNLSPVFFFLLANPGPFDRNPSPKTASLKKLIKKISRDYTTGIHPSYASNSKPKLLPLEINRLEKIIERPALHSRQHYLRLSFPITFQRLIQEGIQHDYSLGYADMAGFRAGTSRSFTWYDLSLEQETGLKLHPFTLMEVTLQQYQQQSPEEATASILFFIQEIKKVGGVFRPLWHNSSFSSLHGWEAWSNVYEELLKHATTQH